MNASCKVWTLERFLDFTRWLARSGHLAKSVHLDVSHHSVPNLVTDPTWEAALAGALQRAALAAPHGLQLQSFTGWASSSVVLRALPSSHLTQLQLGNLNVVRDSSVGDVVAGLAGLTSLQHLWLSSDSSSSADPAAEPGGVEAYLPALPPLTNLTSLTLRGSFNLQQLHIPDLLQLQELQLVEPRQPRQVRDAQPLLLGHLGSVTKLHIDSMTVQQGDELPPGLQELKCYNVPSTEPLCGLTRLATLYVSRATTPAAQLQELGQSVRSLRDVQLCYESAHHVNRSAAGWAGLPLKALGIYTIHSRSYRVRHRAVLEYIVSQQGLTELDLHGCEFAATAEWQLAGILAQLSSLQSLRMSRLQFQEAEEEEEAAGGAGQQQQQQQQVAGGPAAAEQGPQAAAAAPVVEPAAQPAAEAAAEAVPGVVGWPAILRAAAQLPQLRELSFDEPLTAAAAEQLAAATQLQELVIANPPYGIDGDDDAVLWEQQSPSEPVLIDMLCCLTNMRELELEDQPHLGDAAMPVIGRLLTRLTSLSLDSCRRISDAGLAYLTGLRQLEDLSLIDTGVTMSAARALLPGVQLWIE
jgi:Leucine-rich repeat (LRR) protein